MKMHRPTCKRCGSTDLPLMASLKRPATLCMDCRDLGWEQRRLPPTVMKRRQPPAPAGKQAKLRGSAREQGIARALSFANETGVSLVEALRIEGVI